MPNFKPYRTKAQKAEARRTARKDKDGAWRSDAPFSIHGQAGEWVWDVTHKVPVRRPGSDVRPLVPGPQRNDYRDKAA